MNITLRNIDADNWREAINLKVSPDQESFVAPNVRSIAQSKVEPFWEIQAIYHEDTMVGFVMHGEGNEEGSNDKKVYWICRFMLGAVYQGKGYGRYTMNLLLAQYKEQGVEKVYLSVDPENGRAIALYTSLGFVDTGKMEYGEKVYGLSLSMGTLQ